MKTTHSFLAALITVLLFVKHAAAQWDESIYTNGKEMFLHKDTSAAIKSIIGRYVEGATYLVWTVANQKQNGSFIIYRSSDGENYEIIGVKESVRTSGNTEIGYYFIDKGFESGFTYYYKIFHLGQDNTFLMSSPVSISVVAACWSTHLK